MTKGEKLDHLQSAIGLIKKAANRLPKKDVELRAQLMEHLSWLQELRTKAKGDNRGSFWADPVLAKRAKLQMSKSSVRRWKNHTDRTFRVTWPGKPPQVIRGYPTVAKLVGLSVKTLRCYLALYHDVVHRYLDDEPIKIERLPRSPS